MYYHQNHHGSLLLLIQFSVLFSKIFPESVIQQHIKS